MEKVSEYIRIIMEARGEIAELILSGELQPVNVQVINNYDDYFARLTYDITYGEKSYKLILSLNNGGYVSCYDEFVGGLIFNTMRTQVSEFVKSWTKKLLEKKREDLQRQLNDVNEQLGAGE